MDNDSAKSFFGMLPRELRDKIYDLTFDYEIETDSYLLQFRASLPHLRLISRQFKDEYDEQTPRNATFSITDRGPLPPTLRHEILVLSPPRLATHCTALEITQNMYDTPHTNSSQLRTLLHFRCATLTPFITQHLPNLRRVHIRANFNFARNFDLIDDPAAPFEDALDAFRGWYDVSALGNSIEATIELRHLDVFRSSDFRDLAPSVLGIEILTETLTLATLWEREGRMKKEFDMEAFCERKSVEERWFAAWRKACTR
jgi:hypothetical protein